MKSNTDKIGIFLRFDRMGMTYPLNFDQTVKQTIDHCSDFFMI